MTRLLDYQHEDGGWGWWKTDENHPFMTAYAIYGLLETRANGYQVNDWKIRRGLGALVKLYREYPRAVPALKAYMLFVFARAACRHSRRTPATAPPSTARLRSTKCGRDATTSRPTAARCCC